MNDKLFEFVYRNAMHDATLEQAYDGKKDILISDRTNDVRTILKEHINKIIDGDYINKDEDSGKVKYDDDFYKLTELICNKISKQIPNNDFTFGNAQKLINITVKHFYLLAYKDPNIKQNFKFCHCPMDRIMIAKVARYYRQAIKDKNADKSNIQFKIKGKEVAAWSSISWGSIKYTEPSESVKYGIDIYKKYQTMVRFLSHEEKIIPVEYDYKHFFEE